MKIGIDWGGTKIEGIALDPSSGEEIVRKRVEAPKENYDSIIETVRDLIFGISKDSLKTHEGFKKKFNFPFELIADVDEKICSIFDVIKEKSMYGKKYMGIERSTFLINSEGKLIKEWRKVKVKGHVEEVLSSLN